MNKRFTFLCTNGERNDLKLLANFYHRSQGDTIRMLIRNAVQPFYQEMEREYCESEPVEHDDDENPFF